MNAKTVLVLGGGGIKAFATLPLFRYFKEHSIAINSIVGCSGGALLGALYSLGMPFKEMLELVNKLSQYNFFSQLNYKNILAFLHAPMLSYQPDLGFVHSNAIKKTLLDVFGERKIEDLPIPLSIVVTRVDDGRCRVLTQGRLVDALYASITIFPVMECIRINNEPYVDGAFSNPIPVNVGLEEAPDILLMTTFTFKPDHHPSHFFRFINNLFCLSIEQYGLKKVEHWLRQAQDIKYVHLDYILSEPLSIIDTHQLNTIIQIGEQVLKQQEYSLRMLYG